MSDNAPADCVVVGGGPAGMLAALYLQRFRRRVRLVDAGQSRARWIPLSRNCPGFPDGIRGSTLLERLRAQVERQGVRIEADRIHALSGDADRGFVLGGGAHDYRARRVVIATGVVDTLPAWPGIEAAIHAGVVRLCAICDAYETATMRLAVYGPLDAAIAHGCFLRSFCPEVTAVHPPEAASHGQRARAAASGVRLQAAAEAECRLRSDGFVVTPGAGAALRFDAVYVAMGATARTDWAATVVPRQPDDRELEVDAQCRTATPGVYAIGDVVSALNQLSVAFGHAAIAASAVHQDLQQRPLG